MTDFARRRETMVDTQVRPNDVTKFPIIEAMLAVPREAYVPEDRREAAYVGENLSLPGGRVMLEPRTLAKLLEALDVQPGEKVLVVGAGSGYSAALLARMGAQVVALDESAGAAVEGVTRRSGALAAGSKADGPFDAMLIEGAIEQMPAALAAQLSSAGRVVALWREGALGSARLGRVTAGVLGWRNLFHAAAPVLPGFEAGREFRL